MRHATLILLLWLACATCASAALVPPPGLQSGDTYHRIFVTSFDVEVVTSNSFPPSKGVFGSVQGGDWNVNRAAYEAGLLPGWNGLDLPYKAILSDTTTNAKDHISIQGPIYNMQNELIALDAADLWDGALLNAIKYNELGQAVAEGTRVWTGSDVAGNKISSSTANSWSNPNLSGAYGFGLSLSSIWVTGHSMTANVGARLYGLSDPLIVPEPSAFILAGIAGIGFIQVARRRRATRFSAQYSAVRVDRN